jgi:hypothetical protein
MSGIESLGRARTIGELMDYFKAKNKNGDQYLSKNEINEAEISLYDTSKDGRLSLFEVLNALQAQLGIKEPRERGAYVNVILLESDQIIEGKRFEAGTRVWFDKQGKLSPSYLLDLGDINVKYQVTDDGWENGIKFSWPKLEVWPGGCQTYKFDVRTQSGVQQHCSPGHAATEKVSKTGRYHSHWGSSAGNGSDKGQDINKHGEQLSGAIKTLEESLTKIPAEIKPKVERLIGLLQDVRNSAQK